MPARSRRMPIERFDHEEPRSPPAPAVIPLVPGSSRVVLSPRRSTKSRKRSGGSLSSSVAQRRMMDSMSGGLSSDSGIGASPLCHSPLVALPLPDIPPSASDAERAFFPPERPARSEQRRTSPIPSPSDSPLALQPLALHAESSRDELRTTDETRTDDSEELSPGRASPNNVPVPLSPGSTLAQTRPATPISDPTSSKASGKPHGKEIERSPSPPAQPAVRHAMFYMLDEMVTLKVC